MRKAILILFFIFPFLYSEWKDGFKFPPSLPQVAFREEWEVKPLAKEEEDWAISLLSKPLIYLAKGNQSYVFVTQDQKYVVKLFRYKATRFPFVYTAKRFLKSGFGKKTKNPFLLKMEKTFCAAKIAFDLAKSCTRLHFCHLNLTQGKLPVGEFHVGKSVYKMPLDRCRFVIQEKAVPFKEAFLEVKSDPEKIQAMIDSFTALLDRRIHLGIRNSDPNLGPNFGFIQTQAVEIDFGNYRKVEMNAEERRWEKERFMQRFDEFLQKNQFKN